MKKELEEKLRKEFPVLFGPNKYAEFLRGFGFECGDGWYEVIREFGKAVNDLQDPEHPVVALIVKEKFGRLTIQGLTNMTDELWSALDTIEAKSLHICEDCGKPGQPCRSNYWIRTVCKEHSVTERGDKFEPYEMSKQLYT